MHDVTQYPFVFFPVGLNLRGRTCVVIGDDREAVEKAAALEEAGAAVRRIADAASFRDDDLRDAFFVVSTPNDETLSARLRGLADRKRFLLCTIDQPRYGFVAMQAVAKTGPVRIAVSTGGIAPRVGRRFREALQRVLDARFLRFINCLNAQRERNRLRLPSPAERRRAMLDVCEGFSVGVSLRYPAWFEQSEASRGPQVRDGER